MSDQPYYSGAERMGRNKELTDDFTLRDQAAEAMAKSRKSAGISKSPNATPRDAGGPKKVTRPPFSV